MLLKSTCVKGFLLLRNFKIKSSTWPVAVLACGLAADESVIDGHLVWVLLIRRGMRLTSSHHWNRQTVLLIRRRVDGVVPLTAEQAWGICCRRRADGAHSMHLTLEPVLPPLHQWGVYTFLEELYYFIYLSY